MADSQDSYDQPYADPNGPGSPIWNRVIELYQHALGRAPESDDVIRQWVQGSGGDFAQLQQAIYATPEAQAYSARTAQAPKATETPTQPGPAGPGPASTSGVGTGPGPSAPGNIPTYNAPPALEAPPPFSYDAFKAPTQDEVLTDPDYQLTRDQGIQAIGHKNAALGTLNTGGTIGDFIGFAGNLAHAKYGDIYNRDFNTYSANRANAFDTYKTNYGIGKDVYDTNARTQYQDPFTNNLASAQLGQQNNQFNSSLDFNKWIQNYKMSVTDPFDQKYRLLGLL